MRNSSRWLSSRFLVVFCALALAPLALAPVAASADPSISGFSSNPVPLNSFLTLYGSGFGDAQGQSTVLIGGRQVPVLAWSVVAIHILVNPMAFDNQPVVLDATYPVQVIVPGADNPKSNLMNLTISSAPAPANTPDVVDQQTLSDQPSISGFQAATFCPGNFITIYGSGFGFSQGSGYVTVTVPFKDTQGNPFTLVVSIPVLAWSENAIHALLSIPSGAQFGSYPLTVIRGNGKTSSATVIVTACP